MLPNEEVPICVKRTYPFVYDFKESLPLEKTITTSTKSKALNTSSSSDEVAPTDKEVSEKVTITPIVDITTSQTCISSVGLSHGSVMIVGSIEKEPSIIDVNVEVDVEVVTTTSDFSGTEGVLVEESGNSLSSNEKKRKRVTPTVLGPLGSFVSPIDAAFQRSDSLTPVPMTSDFIATETPSPVPVTDDTTAKLHSTGGDSSICDTTLDSSVPIGALPTGNIETIIGSITSNPVSVEEVQDITTGQIENISENVSMAHHGIQSSSTTDLSITKKEKKRIIPQLLSPLSVAFPNNASNIQVIGSASSTTASSCSGVVTISTDGVPHYSSTII